MSTPPHPRPSRGLPHVSRTATLVLLAVFVAECAVGSSGRWLVVGPVSIRMVIFVLTVAVSAPVVWQQRRALLAHPMVRITALFGATLLAWAGWGLARGNHLPFVVADVTTWLALALVPVVLAVAPTPAEVQRLTRVLFFGSVALAGATVLGHLLGPTKLMAVNEISTWLTAQSLGGLADAGGGVLRIYLRSQVLMIPALLVGLQTLACGGLSRRGQIGYAAASGTLVLALLVSLTRALWIGTAVAVVAFALWHALRGVPGRALVRAALAVGAASLVLFGVATAAYQRPALLQAATTRLSPDLLVVVPTAAPTVSSTGSPAPKRPTTSSAPRTSGADPSTGGASTPPRTVPSTTPRPLGPATETNEQAARIRDQSLALHRQFIAQRPLTGWGLGYNLDAVRDDGRTEYLYWDLLMKLGILGMVPFVLLYGWAPWRTLRDDTGPLARTLCAGLLGVAASSYFNPFLNSTLGIAVLLLSVAAVTARTDAAPAAARSAGGAHRAPRRRSRPGSGGGRTPRSAP